MRFIKYFILVAFGAMFFSACTESQMSRAQLSEFIQNSENGLLKSDSLEHISYEVYYRPVALLQKKDTTEKESSNFLSFKLKISNQGKDLFYSTKVRYGFEPVLQRISFDLKSYIFGVYDRKDTVALLSSNYAREYAISDGTSVLLNFERKPFNGEFDIVIKDVVFESLTRVIFKYRKSDIEQADLIKLKY